MPTDHPVSRPWSSVSQHLQRWSTKRPPFIEEREWSSILREVRADVLTDYALGDVVEDTDAERLDHVMQQISDGYPVAYATGKKYWYKWSWYCVPGVLIPRSETEELLAWILEAEPAHTHGKALDVGCGSGVLAIGLALERSHLRVTAADISAQARDLTVRNAASLDATVTVVAVDLLDQETWADLASYDIIVSNPPYIPRREKTIMDASVLAHEPGLALFTEDAEGIQFYKAIAELASQKLLPGGRLYLELNEHHAQKVADHLYTRSDQDKGFTEIEIRKDIHGKDRMLRCLWKG